MRPNIIIVVKVLALSALALFLFATTLEIYGSWHDEWSGYNASMYVSDGMCNIAVIPIHGEIIGYEERYSEADSYDAVSPEDVRTAIKYAENDPYIQGILFRLDSGGGSPAGGEAIMHAIQSSNLYTAALIGDMAASSGYMIATGADTIIASAFSDIGSIGVTMSYLDMSKSNEDLGYEFIDLSSAPYKDYMNPDRPLSEEEKALLKRDLTIYHDAFVELIATNRELPLEKVSEIADGSSMPATLALEHGLIDGIGNADTVRTWFANTLSLPQEEIILCE